MRVRFRYVAVALFLSHLCMAAANRVPVGKLLEQMVKRSTLAEPGGRPFYLKATITDKDDENSEFAGTVEEYWISPTKWRRIIKLRDFSQTRVVNGDGIYEQNVGDYFPVTDEMLAEEIIDPLPRSAVDLMNSVEMMGAEPGSGIGQCMAEKYFNDVHGQETRVLLAYDCKTGLLIYLWSPTCCYGVMTDYRKFHNKMVAYATKDNPINIHIDSLRDLDKLDETLFTISRPTPPEKRITTIKLSEAEARSLVITKSEIKWPPNEKSKEKAMTVNAVVGRDGRVKEARTYSPVDNPTEDAALTAIRQWTFQPQNIDGVPAQIETSFVIPFPPEFQGGTAAQSEVRSIFDQVRAANDIRVEGGPAFHMNAGFHSEDGAVKGSYEETWVSPKKWRRQVKLNGAPVIEVRTEDAFFRKFSGKYAPRLADDVIDAISFSLPGDNGIDLHEPDWAITETKLGNLPAQRLSNGYVNPQGRPDALTQMYFVEENTRWIRGRYHYSLTVFNNLQRFGAKTVARKLTMMDGSAGKLEITVDALEIATSVSDTLFGIPGEKPVYTEDENEQFTPPRSVYMVNPSIPGWHGKATCGITIDEHGHVRDVDVKGTSDESAIRAIRAALMNWEYEPATINGHPSLGFAHVNVE